MSLRLLSILGLAGLLISCGSTEFVPPPPSAPPANVAPDFMSAGPSARSLAGSDFRFRNGDRLGLGIYRTDNFASVASGTYRVGSTGRISLPSVGEVGIEGLTALDAAAAAEGAYRRTGDQSFLGVRPQISTINGVSIVLLKGRVKNPGIVRYTSGMTLGGAFKAAGGRLDPTTSSTTVNLYRKGRRTTLTVADGTALGTVLQAGDFITLNRSF